MTVGGVTTTTQKEQQKHLLSSTSTTAAQQYNSFTKHHHHPQDIMLATHQRLPVHMEYLQPHLNGVPETKPSPLALLAATCSSIGKTDAEKKEVRTTTTTPVILSKLSPSQESKKTTSSFQPYKRDERSHSRSPVTDKSSKHVMRSSPPILVSNTNIVSSKVVSSIGTSNSKHFRVNTSPGIREKSREFDDYPKYHHRLSKDKAFKECTVPSSLPHLPHKVAMLSQHSHHNHSDCSQCKPGRPHTNFIPNGPRPRSGGPHMCSCPMCNSRPTADPKCHFQNAPPSSIYHAPHKPTSLPPPPAPVMTACRDPNCTNCTKVHSSKTLQNFVHPALAQQCTHNSPPLKSHYAPPPPSVSSYDPYYHANGAALPPKPKGHVCNWVSDGKHCGNSFVTSEELYQHLRTHTSLQQQRNNENSDALSPGHPISLGSHPSQGGCTIHGCPCNNGQRKTSPRNSVIPGYSYNPSGPPSSIRYTPYGRPVSTGGHSYPPHVYPY